MDLLSAIDARVSRRKYLPTPIDPASVKQIQALLEEYNAVDGVDMQLVLDNGAAFAGFRKSYGMFTGVQHYVGLLDTIADPDKPGKYKASENTEKMGYYGEKLVLRATALGLGTCWVGGSFDRKSCPFELNGGKMVACTITVGNVADEMSKKERLIRSMTHRKTKALEDMYSSVATSPPWFIEGMKAVQKAPSAINRQPVKFTYLDGTVFASVENPDDVGAAFDLGIAKLHFEIGAGGGTWNFGNKGEFSRKEPDKKSVNGVMREVFVIDGSHFDNMAGFYDEIEKIFTLGLDWEMGRNLNAFNDILRGGFGRHDYGKPILIQWLNYEKSVQDLGIDKLGIIESTILDTDNSGHDCLLEKM